MTRARTFVGFLLTLLLVGAPAALAQETGPQLEIADVNLSRYDEAGRVTMVVELQNLTEAVDPSQIQVSVDGSAVEDLEVQPISQSRVAQGVVLVIDKSGSMAGEPIAAAPAAAQQFISQKRPEDFIALVTFDDEVTVLSNFSNSAQALTERVEQIEAEGGTALYDAVIRATELYASASGNLQRNMIVLTDGADENSTASLEDAVTAVESSDVRTFGVALESDAFTATEIAEIVSAGDGTLLTTTDPEELSALYGEIRRELDNTLVVRFNSPVSEITDATFEVAYNDLQASVVQSVPGYVVRDSDGAGPTTTQTFPEPTTVVVESQLPIDAGQMVLLITVTTGLAVALLLYILLGGNRGDDVTFTRRLAAYGQRKGGSDEEKAPLLQRIPLLNRFTRRAEEEAEKRGLTGAINATLEQGNIPLTAGEAILAMFGIAILIGLGFGLATLSLIGGVVAGLLAMLLAYGVIRFIGTREKKRFEDQLPDTLTLISTSLRAGYSLLQAVEAVAQEAPNPTAREFGRAIAEARLGIPVTDALNGITERTQSSDFEWAVMAIEIQREVGGNLAEVLQTVADTMLARNRLKGEIRALTAEGRISAIVLGSLPFAMALFLWTSNRSYLMPLLENTMGQIAVGVGLLLIAGGIFWLRKIVNIEV